MIIPNKVLDYEFESWQGLDYEVGLKSGLRLRGQIGI